MSAAEADIRREGRVGRITVNRPKALNAITHDIVRAVSEALPAWAADDDIAMLVIDAVGEKAFCAGGDLMEIYRAGVAGDFEPARAFWRDEYRMNAALFRFPKPVASFLHGFTMGGGVGLGCHGSHRVVGDTSQIAMPETSIGLVPDVGGSLLLARAPGRLGESLATTARRMGPGDAIHAGFADYYLPEARWEALKAELAETGDWEALDRAAEPPPESPLAAMQPQIDRHFAGDTLGDILRALRAEGGDFAEESLQRMERNAPLAMAAAVETVHRMRGAAATIERALGLEHRYTWRAIAQGDFLEGIRAMIVDKDRTPRWTHTPDAVPLAAVAQMLMPLGEAALDLGGRT